ncbi:hypothetical protein E2C06_22005 [Dankookia rubra]|uniref:Uncharacterized protein n=1 Tax=Dankookia rubra TaxID=1442381 RepID=A0A4V3A9S9_9PROT|nr:hypothetical protein E2C06_22005 [Dankookia rubra]
MADPKLEALHAVLTHCEAVVSDSTVTVRKLIDRATRVVSRRALGPNPGQRGFAVQPRRWVIERTFASTSRYRRLAHDHAATPSSPVAYFVLAAATVLLRQLAKAP